ncbi:MAG: VIT1/CCC1 transporter family protein [Telluria sp.]
MPRAHRERHRLESIGWLRAAVLGANDGIVSTASLILGVASAHASHASIVTAGVAGLVAGAMSMATGEYVSVQSQADSEQAALETERHELRHNPEGEHQELAGIYVARGVDPALAKQVASQLMGHDALDAHARDELGISKTLAARPLQASLASALSFSAGAVLPLLVVLLTPHSVVVPVIVVASLAFLALLGGVAASAGGARVGRGVVRVTFWSALSMAVASAVGMLVGANG